MIIFTNSYIVCTKFCDLRFVIKILIDRDKILVCYWDLSEIVPHRY